MKFTLFTILILLSSCAKTLEVQYVSQFANEQAWVQVNNKVGVITDSLEMRIPFILDSIVFTPGAEFNSREEIYGWANQKACVYRLSEDTLLYETAEFHPERFVIDHQTVSYKNLIIRSNTGDYFKGQTPEMGAISISGDTLIPFVFREIRMGLEDEFIGIMGRRPAERYKLYNEKGQLIWNTYNVGMVPWRVHQAYWILGGGNLIKLWRFIPLSMEDSAKMEKDTTSFVPPACHPGPIPKLDKVVHFEQVRVHQLDGDSVITANENCWIRNQGKWHLINANFEVISKEYDDVLMNKHWGVVRKGDHLAFINTSGQFITSFSFIGRIDQYRSTSNMMVGEKEKQFVVYLSDGKVVQTFPKVHE